MDKYDAIKELEEEWVKNIDSDKPDGRLITALEMAIDALKGGKAPGAAEPGTITLKPCPFCGSKAETSERTEKVAKRGMTIEDGIAKEKFLEERAASDVEFRKELLRRNGPDPYIEYWLDESETKRKYHEQVAEWLEELKRLRLKPDLMDEETTIMGYRIRDLIITAERIQKEGVDPWKLRNSTEDYMAGYERARNDIDEAMARQMQEIMITQNKEEKQEGTE